MGLAIGRAVGGLAIGGAVGGRAVETRRGAAQRAPAEKIVAASSCARHDMLVEEVPKTGVNKGSTVYFSSSVNMTARPFVGRGAGGGGGVDGAGASGAGASSATSHSAGGSAGGSAGIGAASAARTKVNYNLNDLMNIQTGQLESVTRHGGLKLAQQIQLERLINKRFGELNRENALAATFELPKNFADARGGGGGDRKAARVGNTQLTKRILAARRNLSLYLEEERNVILMNTILSLSYQFVGELEPMDAMGTKRQKLTRSLVKPKVRLCCVCGADLGYARCERCGLFLCSVRCNNVHLELRCT